MSNFQRAETQAVNDFIAARRAGKFTVTAFDAKALCADWHEATIDLPEFNWVRFSFEDMADEWHSAIDCARDAHDERTT